MDFNVGDKVVCISGHMEGPTQGETYIVKGVRLDCSDIWLEGLDRSWGPRRFELVTSAVAEPTYMELFL